MRQTNLCLTLKVFLNYINEHVGKKVLILTLSFSFLMEKFSKQYYWSQT